MFNGIIIVSTVMTLLFLFAVYEAIKSINKEYDRLVASREFNERTSSIAEGDIIYPIMKSSYTSIEKRTNQEPLTTPYESVINQYKDIKIFTSPKWPYHTRHPIPTHDFNKKIINNLSQKLAPAYAP